MCGLYTCNETKSLTASKQWLLQGLGEIVQSTEAFKKGQRVVAMPWPAGAWQQYTVVPDKGLVCSLCPTLSVDWAVSSYSGRSSGDSAGLLTCHMGKDLRFIHSSLSSQPVTQVRFCRSISIVGQGAVLCYSCPFALVHSICYHVARPSCGCQGSLLDH